MKPKTCNPAKGGCGQQFTPARPLQKACSPECARNFAAHIAAKRAECERRDDKARTRVQLEALRPRQYWLKKAQAAVNRYVRARDFAKGCISCHQPATWGGQWHASHFRSVGAASAVRYHLWNIHKACSPCNNHKSGNLEAYTPRLIALIGADRVEWLKAQNQRVPYPVDYLKRLAAVFNKKATRKERRNG